MKRKSHQFNLHLLLRFQRWCNKSCSRTRTSSRTITTSSKWSTANDPHRTSSVSPANQSMSRWWGTRNAQTQFREEGRHHVHRIVRHLQDRHQTLRLGSVPPLQWVHVVARHTDQIVPWHLCMKVVDCFVRFLPSRRNRVRVTSVTCTCTSGWSSWNASWIRSSNRGTWLAIGWNNIEQNRYLEAFLCIHDEKEFKAA